MVSHLLPDLFFSFFVVSGFAAKISIAVVTILFIFIVVPPLTSGHFVYLEFITGGTICTDFIDIYLCEVAVEFHLKTVSSLDLGFCLDGLDQKASCTV